VDVGVAVMGADVGVAVGFDVGAVVTGDWDGTAVGGVVAGAAVGILVFVTVTTGVCCSDSSRARAVSVLEVLVAARRRKGNARTRIQRMGDSNIVMLLFVTKRSQLIFCWKVRSRTIVLGKGEREAKLCR